MIGHCLSGRYEIRQTMGEGGMAIVYRAVDTLLDRPVAVKVLRPEFSHDQDFIRRFQREARAAAQLSHPNIVQVYDVGRDNGVDYIVMECVAGHTLEQKIRREGALPVAVAVDLTRQVLEALRHAHAHGVIHRDIKPQNILLTDSGQVKVTDFGIARAVSGATLAETGTIMGSAHYISPEQACGRHTGVQSDLYSVGVVLFEMLTGTRPFDGDTAVTVAVKHLQERVPSPRALNPAVPKSLERIIFKAMSKEVSRRYASAEEFLSDLRRYRTANPESLIASQDPLEHTRVLEPLPGGNGHALRQGAQPTATSGRPPARRRIRRWLPWMLGVLLLFSGVAYGASYVSRWLNPPLVRVPPLIGVAVDDAVAQLAPHGVEVRILRQRHDRDHPAGVIVWQDPPAGQFVKQGGTVEVIVSRGPEWVQGGVPDVRGDDVRSAEIALEQAGLEVAVEGRYHPTVAKGRVIEQNPQAGTQVVAGTTVTLVVSQGPEPVRVTMPMLIGRPLVDARAELERLGLQIGELRTETSDYPEQFVAAQNPAPGAELKPGQRVSLVVSQGNGSEPEQTVVRVTLPPEPAVQRVEVRVRDRSERIVYAGEHAGGTRFQATVYWYRPRAEVLVFVNGELSTRKLLPEKKGEVSPGSG